MTGLASALEMLRASAAVADGVRACLTAQTISGVSRVAPVFDGLSGAGAGTSTICCKGTVRRLSATATALGRTSPPGLDGPAFGVIVGRAPLRTFALST